VLGELQAMQVRVGTGWIAFGGFCARAGVRHLSIWLLLLALLLATHSCLVALYFGISPLSYQQIGVSCVVLVAVLLTVYSGSAGGGPSPPPRPLPVIDEGPSAAQVCLDLAAARFEQEQARINAEFEMTDARA